MAKINKLASIAMIASLMVASIQPSLAAKEYKETDFGNPSAGRMVADTFIGKPLQLLNAVGSSVVYVISAPFAHHSGNLEQVKERLVTEPWQALQRCHGCTVAEDNYRSSLPSYQAADSFDQSQSMDYPAGDYPADDGYYNDTQGYGDQGYGDQGYNDGGYNDGGAEFDLDSEVGYDYPM